MRTIRSATSCLREFKNCELIKRRRKIDNFHNVTQLEVEIAKTHENRRRKKKNTFHKRYKLFSCAKNENSDEKKILFKFNLIQTQNFVLARKHEKCFE